jgi:hypothetical protein
VLFHLSSATFLNTAHHSTKPTLKNDPQNWEGDDLRCFFRVGYDEDDWFRREKWVLSENEKPQAVVCEINREQTKNIEVEANLHWIPKQEQAEA